MSFHHFAGSLFDQAPRHLATLGIGLCAFVLGEVSADAYLIKYEDFHIWPGDSYYDIKMRDTATAYVHGGEVTHNFYAENYSTINLYDGHVEYLSGYGEGNVYMMGGTVHWLRGYGSSKVTMTEGRANYVYALTDSTVRLRGGSIRSYLYVKGTAYGHVFAENPVLSHSGGDYGDGYVSGTWEDGSTFTIDLRDSDFAGRASDTSSRIVLHAIPEPTSLALLLCGALAGLIRWRR